jgi:hypothetical protein
MACQTADAKHTRCLGRLIRSLRHVSMISHRGTAFAQLVITLLKGVFMATKDSERKRQSEWSSSIEDDDMVRGRADEMEDRDSDTDSDEFDDTEDLNDEEEEEGEGSF